MIFLLSSDFQKFSMSHPSMYFSGSCLMSPFGGTPLPPPLGWRHLWMVSKVFIVWHPKPIFYCWKTSIYLIVFWNKMIWQTNWSSNWDENLSILILKFHALNFYATVGKLFKLLYAQPILATWWFKIFLMSLYSD